MGQCPVNIKEYMHEYLDGEISPEHKQILQDHLAICSDCQKHLHELEKTTALVQSMSHIKALDDFTLKVIEKLPKEKKKVGIKRWFSHHPFLTAAAVFVILMSGSLFSTWGDSNQFSVTKDPNIIIENNTAVVPEGETIKGDIVVRNGDIRIEGTVEGNVTVVNGDKYLASAGEVTGEIEEINEIFSWLWYQIKNGFNSIMNLLAGL